MEHQTPLRKRVIGVTLASVAYFAGAVGLWAYVDGQLESSADSVRKEEAISFSSQEDWQQGTHSGTIAENGVLKLAAAASPTTPAPTTSSNMNAPTTTVTTTKWKDKTGSSATASCTASVPDDFWELHPGDVSGVLDRVHKQWAGYSVPFVNSALGQYAAVQPAPLNDPNLYSEDRGVAAKAWGHLILSSWEGPGDPDSSALNFTSELNNQIGDYTLRSVESDMYKGLVYYYTQGITSNLGYGYFIPARWAFTKKAEWSKDGAKVAQIAASLKCTLNGRSMSGSNDVSVGGSNGSSQDANGSDDGYNPWLGTEYVHDSNGNNYIVDPSTQWSETGPAGEGYYIPISGGNFYELLQPGRVD